MSTNSRSTGVYSGESSDSEPSMLRQIDMDIEKSSRSPSTLRRKGSALQTSVEVLRCRFGKSGEAPEKLGDFRPSKEWTPIFYSVYHQREAALSHFLRAGASPDDVTNIGQPPLCIAVANGYVEIAKILLGAGADINATTREGGETALHIAVKNGRVDLMDLLLSHGPNLELKTQTTGETPLHYAAAKSGSLAVVMSLLQHGASYNTLNVNAQTPAEAALKANNINGAVAIINAANTKRNELAKEKEMLLKHVQKTQGRFSIGNDLIADIFAAACDPESNVLVEAIKRNDVLLVEMFLEKGSDPDRKTVRGLQPIFVALSCAGAPVVKAILKRNPDLSVRDEKGLSVLQAAFECPLTKEKDTIQAITEALIEEGADAKVTYPDGKTLLHRAVSPSFSHMKIAQMLIDAGVEVNAQDSEGNTALHVATHSKMCIDMLLKNKANPQQFNAKGLTPLLFAATQCKKDNEPVLDSLIKVSNFRKTNAQGQTPLHLAAANGLDKTVRLLLRARADPTAIDNKKNTPLLLAVKNHQWSIAPIFVATPSVNAWDKNGFSALHHVVANCPKAPATWEHIATTTVAFCERGVSRSIRDQSGATPLILAVKTLPEEGLPVIEALLAQKAGAKASWNFADHEDHKKRDALYYAATMGKPIFVDALLRNGATFEFEDWTPNKHMLQSSEEVNKKIYKSFAQQEWVRRTVVLRQHPKSAEDEVSSFMTVLPTRDLEIMISMGLDVNNLPKSPLGKSLLWAILRHISLQPPLAPEYLLQVLSMVLDAGADPNASSNRHAKRTSWPCPQQGFTEPPRLTIHPLTFVLEECPGIDIEVVRLLLARDAKPGLASGFYKGRFPLHCAVKARRADVVEELLLEQGNVECIDDTGRTPLFFAAEAGDLEIVTTLLTRGAKLDVLDSEKNTLLHAAAVGGSDKVIASLLRAGAKLGNKNAKGLTPMACVPEGLDEKEKGKIQDMLKGAEKRGMIVTEVTVKPAVVKPSEVKTEKTKPDARQEEEKAVREAEAKAKQISEQQLKQRLQKQQQEDQEKPSKLTKEPPTAAAAAVKPQPQIQLHAMPPQEKPQPIVTTDPIPSPPLHKPRSTSIFRKSSLFFTRHKSAIFSSESDSSAASAPKQKHTTLLSLRISAPFKQRNSVAGMSTIPQSPSTPNILRSPDFFTKDFGSLSASASAAAAAAAAAANTHQRSSSPSQPERPAVPVSSSAIQTRLLSPRADSGLGQRKSTGKDSILDLQLVNEKLKRESRIGVDKGEKADASEFSDWLKMSDMLENL
ncbi:hypothetical protein GGP41_008397 [Bipolaris sorokiniana]|uniref:Ankyrin repeat protein n=1 Tax=Cochliobolus sativus TaxID=45130 RepID=A0A8H6DS20_COCSA|nr:hypothetical protein GGP41_008397 [Bipolaris sorokiniana]